MRTFSTRGRATAITGAMRKAQSHHYSWLSTDKAPLYVSMFFAALAWTLVRTVDRIAATPIVEYKVDPHSQSFASDGPDRVIGVHFRNMSASRPIDCLYVFLGVPMKNSASDPTLKLNKFTPSVLRINGPVFANVTIQFATTSNAEVELTNFPLGADIELGIRASGEDNLRVRARTCAQPKTTGVSAAMPVMLERSATTRLIEHELHVLWAGLVLWSLVLLGLATARSRRADTGG